MDGPAPLFNSTIFNANAFKFTNYLTKEQADAKYLPLTGGSLSGLVTFITDTYHQGEIFMTGNAKDLHINGIGSKINFSGLGAGIIMSSTTSSIVMSSTLSNSIQTAGGISAGGAIGSTVAAGGDMITLTSSSTSARNSIKFVTDAQSWEVGARGSAATNPNQLYIFNGGYRMLMNASGDTSFLSTTDSSSATTGCLKLSGGLGVVKNIYTTGSLTIDRNGSQISIVNGGTSSLIEQSASPDMLRLVNGFALNIGSLGCRIGSSSITAARYQLDFGSTSSDIHICLNQVTAGVTGAYGFGANNSSLESHSGGDFTWYTGTLASGSLGTKRMTLSSTGNVSCVSGHFTGFTATGPTGPGLKMHYSSARSEGQIFSYDYTTSQYLTTALGGQNNLTLSATNGFCNMNTTNQTCSFPLSIFGSANATRSSGAYGFLNSTGAGNVGSASFTDRPFSLYTASGILVASGEIDCFSDVRLKQNVVPLDDSVCSRFIENVEPIKYQYKSSPDETHYGFSAQQLMGLKLEQLVGFTGYIGEGEDAIENQRIQCYDGDYIDIPSDVRLTVSMLDMIPILTKCLQTETAKLRAMIELQSQRIDEQSQRIDEQAAIISELSQTVDDPREKEPRVVKPRAKRTIKRLI